MTDVVRLDEAMAQRIIERDQDVPAELQNLVAIVEELRQASVPVGGDDVVLDMAAARQAAIGRSQRLRVRTRSSVVAALAAAVCLAAAGDLPAAAQNAVHDWLGGVGIHVPCHEKHPHAPPGSDGAGTMFNGIGTGSGSLSTISRQPGGNHTATISFRTRPEDVTGNNIPGGAPALSPLSAARPIQASPSHKGAAGSESAALGSSNHASSAPGLSHRSPSHPVPARSTSATSPGRSYGQLKKSGGQSGDTDSSPGNSDKGRQSNQS